MIIAWHRMNQSKAVLLIGAAILLAGCKITDDLKQAFDEAFASPEEETVVVASTVTAGAEVADEQTTSAATAPAEGPVSRDTVLAVQRMLSQLDYQPGPIDGLFGTRTEKAVEAFQSDIGHPTDGVIAPALVLALVEAVASSVAVRSVPAAGGELIPP